MTRHLTVLLTSLLISLSGFCQSDTTSIAADHYKTNKFDVAIFPSSYIDFVGGERFTPTRAEIDQAETALQIELSNLNKDLINQTSSPIIHKNLNKYKRQYFGFIDKNGNRILLINSFWTKQKEISSGWLTGRILVLDGGSYYWTVKFNLDTEKLFDLVINGYA